MYPCAVGVDTIQSLTLTRQEKGGYNICLGGGRDQDGEGNMISELVNWC